MKSKTYRASLPVIKGRYHRKTIRMHDKDLEECYQLQSSLPYFGKWNSTVDE